MEFLKHIDKELFLFLNGLHSSFLDPAMPFLTEFWLWIPLFLWWFYLLFKKFRNKVLIIILFVAGLILFSDQGANLIKKSVKRYRPTYNTEIKDKVHVVNDYRGGQYGFISSHAANVFALAFFLFFLLKPTTKTVSLSLFLWAAFVSYTRIYLGVHYPFDILGGALLGSVLGIAFAKLYFRFVK